MPRLYAYSAGRGMPSVRATRECVPSAPTTIRAVIVESRPSVCTWSLTCEFSRSTLVSRARTISAPACCACSASVWSHFTRSMATACVFSPPSAAWLPDCVCTKAPVMRWIAASSPISASRSVRSEISPEQ